MDDHMSQHNNVIFKFCSKKVPENCEGIPQKTCKGAEM